MVHKIVRICSFSRLDFDSGGQKWKIGHYSILPPRSFASFRRVCQSVIQPVSLSVCPSVCLPVCLPPCLSACVPVSCACAYVCVCVFFDEKFGALGKAVTVKGALLTT